MKFDKPVKYAVTNTDTTLQGYENNLYLLIQLSATNDSSIVVLEGDYINHRCKKIFDIGSLRKLSDKQLNHSLLNNLSLLLLNTNETYAFSNRLIEYLLQNTITSQDMIGTDIGTIQTASKFNLFNDYVKNVWSTQLRYYLFYHYLEDSGARRLNKVDINGFVDKDIENYVNTKMIPKVLVDFNLGENELVNINDEK